MAAQTVPFIALLLVGGVWADRLPRQRVMVWTDVVRGAWPPTTGWRRSA